MALKSRAEIVASFVDYLKTKFPKVDTTADRPLSSLLFDSVATELETPFTSLEQIQVEQGVSAPTTSSTEGLADLAYNWNSNRRGAVAGSGIVTFQKLALPTTTIQIGNQDGSGGVVIGTSRQQTGTVVLFVTTQTVYLTPTTTVNPSTGLYEVDASIQCVSLGSIGNVDAGLITALQSAVPGVDFLTNKIATTGGREDEDNTTLALRLQAKSRGLQPGMIDGLVTLAMEQDQVTDAVVVGPNDGEFTRSSVGGAVDLIVLGELLIPTVQYTTYTASQSSILLQNRPATTISVVTGTVGLTQSTLVSGVDYSFSQDLVSVNALSAKSTDSLAWLNSSGLPNAGTTVTVGYQYDKVIGAIQDVVDSTDKHFVTANVLVKRATKILVDVALTLRKTSGFDSVQVENNVSTAITNIINNLGLGDSVQQSDLVVAIEAVNGVDSVVLPLTKLALRGATGVSDLSMTKYQYARVDSMSLTITVTS